MELTNIEKSLLIEGIGFVKEKRDKSFVKNNIQARRRAIDEYKAIISLLDKIGKIKTNN